MDLPTEVDVAAPLPRVRMSAPPAFRLQVARRTSGCRGRQHLRGFAEHRRGCLSPAGGRGIPARKTGQYRHRGLESLIGGIRHFFFTFFFDLVFLHQAASSAFLPSSSRTESVPSNTGQDPPALQCCSGASCPDNSLLAASFQGFTPENPKFTEDTHEEDSHLRQGRHR